jgi:cell division protein FtsL
MKKINKKETPSKTEPLVKVRFMLVGLAILGLIISGPLLIVTKQVYITSVSIKMNEKADSLKLLDKEIAALQRDAEKLSGNSRIETFARHNCNLDYPNVNQIVIVKMKSGSDKIETVTLASVLDVINRSLGVRN